MDAMSTLATILDTPPSIRTAGPLDVPRGLKGVVVAE